LKFSIRKLAIANFDFNHFNHKMISQNTNESMRKSELKSPKHLKQKSPVNRNLQGN